MAEEKVEITISSVRADLKAGLSRDQIGAKYGLNRANTIRLFKHEKLKGFKTFKTAANIATTAKIPVEIVDDMPDEQPKAKKVAPAKKAAPAASNGVEVKDDIQEEAVPEVAPEEVSKEKGVW